MRQWNEESFTSCKLLSNKIILFVNPLQAMQETRSPYPQVIALCSHSTQEWLQIYKASFSVER